MIIVIWDVLIHYFLFPMLRNEIYVHETLNLITDLRFFHWLELVCILAECFWAFREIDFDVWDVADLIRS